MENLLDGLHAVAQISAVTFGVFVFLAVALASMSSYRRHRHQRG